VAEDILNSFFFNLMLFCYICRSAKTSEFQPV